MTIYRATITIVGKKPILFNRFTVDSIPLEKREKTGVPGNDPQEWKRSVMKTEAGQLYLESSYIFGCLRDAGKHIKSGRKSLQPKIASTLIVLENIILLDRFLPCENELTESIDAPVYLDVRSVKNPNTKGRNVRYRIAASAGWKASFQIEWENTIVSKGEMEAAISTAGSFVGLGDGRNIGFGRFVVESLKIDEVQSEAQKKPKKT